MAFIPALVILCLTTAGHRLVSTQPSTKPGAQILYLYSSLERSGREFSCPIEMVSFSCAVKGNLLIWKEDGEEIPGVHFGFNDTLYTGRGHENDCFVYSALLDAARSVNNDSEFLCYSTLTITPGKLSPNLTVEQPCNLSASSRMIQCTSQSISNQDVSSVETMSTQYKIAGIPNITIPGPEHGSMCTFNTSSNSASVVIGTPLCSDNNTNVSYHTYSNLSYYTVELIHNDSVLGTNRVTALGEVGRKYVTTFYGLQLSSKDSIAAKIKAFDQCNQQSPGPVIIICNTGVQAKVLTAHVVISIIIALYVGN